ncbi:MAG: nuclear transport factor 2 family protein [Acidobacteriia bacterium]|nr:nuclear transport factor 2 family protein [Terriglobia bacterium]
MSDLIQTIKDLYAAFGRGDVAAILSQLAPDVSWEVEAPAEVAFAGIRKGPEAVKGFFQAIASDHADPKLEITDYFSSADAVGTFGRYQCTLKKTGKRVDSPVAHLFKFRGGKIVRFVDHINTAAFLEAGQSSAAGR